MGYRHDGECPSDDKDYAFYASLAADRKMAFAYRNALQVASSPSHRTAKQQAEIDYAIQICDIAREKTP